MIYTKHKTTQSEFVAAWWDKAEQETAQKLEEHYPGVLSVKLFYDFSRFLNRKYCSLSCANTRKEVTTAALRWRAEQLRGNVCEICGTTERLQAHHIDGNIGHNVPENIQTLCISCHAKHHHWCRRNGMNIPGRMSATEL